MIYEAPGGICSEDMNEEVPQIGLQDKRGLLKGCAK
jgi:hypothetical protein